MKLGKEITLTESAQAHLLKMAAPYAGLRLSIRGGKGCGGNEYDLLPVTSDAVDAHDDFLDLGADKKLFIPGIDLLKLFGTTIDYIEDDLGNRRIEILNPNESGRCGCGKSVTF